ncbi:MAG: acetyl-CoA hydrolase/transferase family protein [Solirubrobacterales bacterium]
MSRSPDVARALREKLTSADGVLDYLEPGSDVIVGLGNAAPESILDAIEGNAAGLEDLRLHQMLPLRDRDYISGNVPGLRHVSWFLSPHDRDAFNSGKCDLVPNNFSEVPRLMKISTKRSIAIASAAPPDRHGYFSLGLHAEYTAAMIGEVPFFIEANPQMPRTFGENQVHVSELAGWCEADYPLVEVPGRDGTETDKRIAEFVVERIPDGATIQAGIGAVPDQVMRLLSGHRDLGIHTELMGDGLVDLIECGAATGTRKATHRNKAVTTSVLGTARLYDFVRENAGIELWPVDHTNDPRNIGLEPRMTAINGTLEVDFLGQCASESLGSDYWSSSGGQVDYVRGALFADEGQSFIVLHSAPHDESSSRIVSALHPGAAVTTYKNVVDKVVTEHGVAELRGASIADRTRRLIAVAHPKFRGDLERDAREMGYL